MRDVWTRSHLRGSSVRVREVIPGIGVELALSANMSNSTSTVTLHVYTSVGFSSLLPVISLPDLISDLPTKGTCFR